MLFWDPRKTKTSIYRVQNCISSVVTTQIEHYLIFQTIYVHLGQCNDLFRGQKPVFRTIRCHRRAIFAHKMTFETPKKGPEGL